MNVHDTSTQPGPTPGEKFGEGLTVHILMLCTCGCQFQSVLVVSRHPNWSFGMLAIFSLDTHNHVSHLLVFCRFCRHQDFYAHTQRMHLTDNLCGCLHLFTQSVVPISNFSTPAPATLLSHLSTSMPPQDLDTQYCMQCAILYCARTGVSFASLFSDFPHPDFLIALRSVENQVQSSSSLSLLAIFWKCSIHCLSVTVTMSLPSVSSFLGLL